MRDAIYSLLSQDQELMTLLTGELHQALEVGLISRQNTPDAFDANGEIQPCGLLRYSVSTPVDPYPGATRVYFGILLYERHGYSAIDLARRRIRQLLHKVKLTPVDPAQRCWEIQHADDVMDTRDLALNCSMMASRYVAFMRHL